MTKLGRRRAELDAHFASLKAQRESKAAAKRAQREETCDPRENVDAFLVSFNSIRDAVTNGLEEASTVPKTNLKGHMDHLFDVYHSLVKELTDATLFLPSYEVRLAQECLTKLEETLHETNDRLLPKKKFAFSARKTNPFSEKKASSSSTKPSTTTTTAASKAHAYAVEKDASLTYAEQSNKVLVKAPGEIGGRDFTLEKLDGCTVHLCDSLSALRGHKLKGCRVYVGAVGGSVHLEDCVDCVFVLASRQIRIHTSSGCDYYLHVQSKPIIEDCTGLRFAPYNLHYDSLMDHFKAAGLDLSRNLWREVDDFKWLRTQHSPNWSEMDDKDRLEKIIIHGEAYTLSTHATNTNAE